MRAVVVYESVFGNTRAVAEAVADGLRGRIDEVLVVPVGRADDDALAATDLLVVGGPTHARGMSRRSTDQGAVDRATAGGTAARLQPPDAMPGLREWFAARRSVGPTMGAAFDTRRSGPVWLTGRAAPRIGRRLSRWGCVSVVEPVSFLVSGDDHLLPGESERARAWGTHVAKAAREFEPA